jgi:hypothetical protein
VRERLGARGAGAPGITGVLGPVTGIVATAAVAIFLARNAPAPHIETEHKLAPPPQAAEPIQELQRARAITQATPATYTEATKAEEEVTRLVREATAADPTLTAPGELLVGLARAACERFAPSLEGEADIAATEAGKREDYAGAVRALDRFPVTLSGTPSGARVAAARARFAALATLVDPARALLRSTDPGRLAAIESLLSCPNAKLGELAKTPIGEQLLAEKRRILNETAVAAADKGKTNAALELTRAATLEKKADWEGAAAAYQNALGADPDNLEALVAVARIEMLRELPGAAHQAAERARRFAPNRPDVTIITAWFDVLAGAHDRARTLIKGVPEAQRGVLGKRLEQVLGLGPERHVARRVRVFSPRPIESNATIAAIDELASLVDSLVEALALSPEDAPVILYLFEDESESKRFASTVGSSPTPDGFVACGFGTAGTVAQFPLIRSTVAYVIGRRAHHVPGWLQVGLPAVATENTRIPSGKLSLDALEKLGSPKNVRGRQDALESARGFAAFLYVPGGPRALGQYVAGQVADPAKARQDLEAFLRQKRR